MSDSQELEHTWTKRHTSFFEHTFPSKHPLLGVNQLFFSSFKCIDLFLIRRSSNSPDNGQFDAVDAMQRKYYISASQDVKWDTKWTRLFVRLPTCIFILFRQSLGHLLFHVLSRPRPRADVNKHI